MLFVNIETADDGVLFIILKPLKFNPSMFIPTEPPVGCFIVLLCIVPTTTTFDDTPPKFILPVV